MSIYEVLGMFWVILTSTLATIAFFAFAWRGIRQASALMLRGEIETNLDIKRQVEARYFEGLTKG